MWVTIPFLPILRVACFYGGKGVAFKLEVSQDETKLQTPTQSFKTVVLTLLQF